MKQAEAISKREFLSLPRLPRTPELKRVVLAMNQMVEKLKGAGKPVKYVEQPLGDHYLSREADRIAFLQELEAFLKLHNPA